MVHTGTTAGGGAVRRVLFVCMGNICRSPMAQGVAEQRVAAAGLAQRVELDSAGTHAYHLGEPPDPRAQMAAARRGVDLSRQRARQVADGDFHRFDLMLAMDRDNLAALEWRCPQPSCSRLMLFLDLVPGLERQPVPDPYYGGDAGFERVLDLVEQGADALLLRLRADL